MRQEGLTAERRRWGDAQCFDLDRIVVQHGILQGLLLGFGTFFFFVVLSNIKSAFGCFPHAFE